MIFLILGCLVGAGVGYLIDEGRGALWGFFLGPVGWIIAAILKNKAVIPQPHVKTLGASPILQGDAMHDIHPQGKSRVDADLQKWAILKEVDADIRSAAERVSQMDASLDAVLAEKYLALNDKQYLQSIVDVILRTQENKKAAEAADAARFSAEVAQSGLRQKSAYEAVIGAQRISPETGKRVVGIEVYDGSWVGWKGGIVVFLEGGGTMLLNRGNRRDFRPGDEGWK